MTQREVKQELCDVKKAGERVLESLYLLRESLEHEGEQRFPERFGGRFFSGFFRESAAKRAREQILQVRKDLESFQKELKELSVPLDLRMEIGSFLSFADFFFDDPVSDYLVFSRLQNTREDVEDGIQLIEELLEKLSRQ